MDVPVLGLRLNEYRNKFELPSDMGWPNILSKGKNDLGGRHDYGTVDSCDYALYAKLTRSRCVSRMGNRHPVAEGAHQAANMVERRYFICPPYDSGIFLTCLR